MLLSCEHVARNRKLMGFVLQVLCLSVLLYGSSQSSLVVLLPGVQTSFTDVLPADEGSKSTEGQPTNPTNKHANLTENVPKEETILNKLFTQDERKDTVMEVNEDGAQELNENPIFIGKLGLPSPLLKNSSKNVRLMESETTLAEAGGDINAGIIKTRNTSKLYHAQAIAETEQANKSNGNLIAGRNWSSSVSPHKNWTHIPKDVLTGVNLDKVMSDQSDAKHARNNSWRYQNVSFLDNDKRKEDNDNLILDRNVNLSVASLRIKSQFVYDSQGETSFQRALGNDGGGNNVPQETASNDSAILTDEVISNCSTDPVSCKDRCFVASPVACSCHWTCGIYSTCCEDFPVMDSEHLELSDLINSSVIECRDNYLFVSSCLYGVSSNQWDQMKAHDIASVDGRHENFTNSWWLSYVDKNLGYGDLKQRCEGGIDSRDMLDIAPVTDVTSQILFRNIFCAICHNASNIIFWMGFANCNFDANVNPVKGGETSTSGENNLTASTSLPSLTAARIADDNKCQILWFPKEDSGTINGNKLTRTSNTTNEDGSLLNGQLSSMEKNQNKVSKAGVPTSKTTSGDVNLAIKDILRATEEVSRTNLNDVTDRADGTKHVCKMSTSRLPDKGGYWYTLQHVHTNHGIASSQWDVQPGIDESYLQQILRLTRKTDCDQENQLTIDGICRNKSFVLDITMTFNFEETGLIKGDFYQEVQRHARCLRDHFQGHLSNTTTCISKTSNDFPTQGSTNNVFTRQLILHCAEYFNQAINQPRDLNLTPSDLDDNRNGRYAAFVSTAFSSFLQQDDAVSLPATIDYHHCVLVKDVSGTRTLHHCIHLRHTWSVTRIVDAIIGRLSLEALISITCCTLSNIGLIARLALQKVVPFFNSYPGKVQFCLCLSLLLAYTLFLIGGSMEGGSGSCTVVGVLTHLALLCALLWMNVTAFEIWRTFRHWSSQVMSRGRTSLILSTVYTVGIPCVMVTSALLLDELVPWSEYSPSYGKPSCWINGSRAVAIFFVAPCSFVSFVNVIFVVLTLRGLRQQRTSISEFRKPRHSMAVMDTTIVVKIIVLVGVTWLFGLLAALIDNKVIWIIFTILNASLGFFISAVLVLNKRVFSAVQKSCVCFKTENTMTSSLNSEPKPSIRIAPSH